MRQALFGIGVVFICLACLFVLISRARRTTKWGISLSEFFRIALSGFQVVSGGLLMCQIWSNFDSLEKLVGGEGIVAMFMGGVASIWLGCREIRDLAIQR